MKVLVNGEILEILERPEKNGKIVRVLTQGANGKEVVDVWFWTRQKDGTEVKHQETKVGGAFKGMVNFKGLCVPV